MDYKNLRTDQLLLAADRSDPQVRALCEHLERYVSLSQTLWDTALRLYRERKERSAGSRVTLRMANHDDQQDVDALAAVAPRQ